MGILAGIGSIASGVADMLGAGKSLSHSGASGISSAKSFFYNQLSAKREYERNLQTLRESPTAQLEGLRSAGLNPVLYLGNAAYPTVSSGSGVSASPASTPAVDNLGRGINNAIKGMREAKLFDEEIKAKQASNDFNAKRYPKELELLDTQREQLMANASQSLSMSNYYDTLARKESPAGDLGEVGSKLLNRLFNAWDSPPEPPKTNAKLLNRAPAGTPSLSVHDMHRKKNKELDDKLRRARLYRDVYHPRLNWYRMTGY